MNPIITSVYLKKVRHLSDIEIPVCSGNDFRHLIITGKNGSGKTSLLLSIWRYLCKIARDENLNYLSYERQLRFFQKNLRIAETQNNQVDSIKYRKQIAYYKNLIESLHGEVTVHLLNGETLPSLVKERKFLLAYYSDRRLSDFKAPKNPEKPNLDFRIEENKVDQFLKFLIDLKVQRALAAEEGQKDIVNEINMWFDSFTVILRRIFRDESLILEFNYKDYAFVIRTSQGSFPFTGLSAGYSAVLDIVADMMLKMQKGGQIIRSFDLPGIVLIDEIETHLHLELQKEILHILKAIFPNIQFVVTTHSPFVVSAVSNSSIYDLEKKVGVVDLTEYSYESLMEGYFDVDSDSAEIKRRIEQFESLVAKAEKTEDDKQEITRLRDELLALPEWTTPSLKARFNEINLKNSLETVS